MVDGGFVGVVGIYKGEMVFDRSEIKGQVIYNSLDI